MRLTYFLTLFIIGLSICTYANQKPISSPGILDAQHVDFSANNTFTLDGSWEFYWNHLLDPKDFNQSPPRDFEFIDVPSIWNQQTWQGETLSGQGYATYHLKVVTKNAPKLLGIEIPNVYSCYKLFINEELIAKNGVVGTDKSTSLPQWQPTLKAFEGADTLDIICQVANFHHTRGGIHKSFVIGNFESVSLIRERRVVANMLLTGGLLALGSFFLAFYLLKINEKTALYFGLFCFFWAIRSVFSNIYLASSWFELNWSLALRIEYLSLYCSVLFGALFMSKAFDKSHNQLLKYVINIVNLILISLTLVLPPIIFTKLLPAYQLFIAVNLIYAVFVIIKALFENQKEAWFSAISVMLGVSIFGYEMFHYVLVMPLNLVFLNLAYLSIFFLNSLVLAFRFVRAYKVVQENPHLIYQPTEEPVEKRGLKV